MSKLRASTDYADAEPLLGGREIADYRPDEFKEPADAGRTLAEQIDDARTWLAAARQQSVADLPAVCSRAEWMRSIERLTGRLAALESLASAHFGLRAAVHNPGAARYWRHKVASAEAAVAATAARTCGRVGFAR